MQFDYGTFDFYLLVTNPNYIAILYSIFGLDKILSAILLNSLVIKGIENKIQDYLLNELDNFVKSRLQIRSVIVFGGYPRDRLLKLVPNDIDIQFLSKHYYDNFMRRKIDKKFELIELSPLKNNNNYNSSAQVLLTHQSNYILNSINLVVGFKIMLDIHVKTMREPLDFNVNALAMQHGALCIRQGFLSGINLNLFDVINSIMKKEFYTIPLDKKIPQIMHDRIITKIEERKDKMISRGWNYIT